MRINPSSHQIQLTDRVNLYTDIPLAYIDANSKEYNLEVVPIEMPEDSVAIEPIQRVIPYQTFDTDNITLFKTKGTANKTFDDFVALTEDHKFNVLQRIDDKFQYVPKSSVTYVPQEFTYSIVAKKRLAYSNDRIFDLKLACTDLDFAKSLIKIFGDAPDRGLSPSNVWVNNKDLAYSSLVDSALIGNDFVMIDSKDGIYYTDSTNKIDYENYLDACIPIWLSVEDLDLEDSTDETAKMLTSCIYKDLVADNSLFVNTLTDKDDMIVHKLFEGTSVPLVVIEVKDKSFVVLSKKDFFTNIEKNIKIFYETLFYVYEKAYVKSKPVSDWITDIMPDYVISNNNLSIRSKFLSKKRIYDTFSLESKEALYIRCEIDKEFVKVKGIADDYIEFEKVCGDKYKEFLDKPKEPGQIAIYTARKNIMYFDEFVYVLQQPINNSILSYTVESSYIKISINSLKHTYFNIDYSRSPSDDIYQPLYITENYEVKPIVDSLFALVIENNIFSLCDPSEIKETASRLCDIRIKSFKNDTVEVIDIRKRGGGLPKEYKDDYNLLDIGQMQGLSYRKAGTLCVTLPARLKDHKQKIEDVLKRHMAADRYLILLFEDEKQ